MIEDDDDDGRPHADADWSRSGGPDLFTLRAWLGAERAMEEGHRLDDTVNFLQDRVTAIFGADVFVRFSRFVSGQGIETEGAGALLDDERRLRALLDYLLAADGAPEPEDESYEWRAYAPGDGLRPLRRAVRNRRQQAALAFVLPRRRRVAGSRSRDRG